MYPLITCENLTKRYANNVIALNNINLTMTKGRITGILGPNGSGKSTLMKLLAGLLTPSSGKILVNGQAPDASTKQVVSYLPDSAALDHSMTVKQLVCFFQDFYKDFNTDKAYDMLSRLDLDPKKRFGGLSKGTKEKVQLVLTMSRQAELYLLDEPIGGVDPAARDYILDTIFHNYAKDSCLLISTHLIADVEPILDDALFLNYGQIQMYAPAQQIRNTYHTSLDGYFRGAYRC